MTKEAISEVYNMDCVAGMLQYPDKYFDLAIVDIEYGIGASKPSKKPNTVVQKNGSVLNVKQSNYEQKDWDFKNTLKQNVEAVELQFTETDLISLVLRLTKIILKHRKNALKQN